MDTGGSSRRQLTLDLNAASQPGAKKARVQQMQHNFMLTSPDLQMLKLTSPQMREFLTRNATLATPTPGFEFPKSVTEQQALYVKGFEDALEDIKAKEQHQQHTAEGDQSLVHHHTIFPSEQIPKNSSTDAILTIEKATAAYNRTKQNIQRGQTYTQLPVAQLPPPLILAPLLSAGEISRPSSSASGSLDSSIEAQYLNSNMTIKEEEDDSDFSSGQPSSSSRSRRKTSASSNNDLLSPINLESQERIKLDRKRQRNRLAASKCRKRKLERIAQLDAKVNELKGENSDLATIVKNLKETVCRLKQEVLDHVNTGCQINMADEPSMYPQ